MPNLQTTWLYYAPCSDICELCIHYKNHTVTQEVRYTTYCDFYRCGLQSSPQEHVQVFAKKKKKKVGHPYFRLILGTYVITIPSYLKAQ
jgi:hypothetical protein